MITALLLAAVPARAAIDGITSPDNTFNLTASAAHIYMPDGASIYSWGYGIGGHMQLPGPTLIVTQGATVTVRLTNNLPPAAGNVSIVFPGHQVTTLGGVPGLLTQEALPGAGITYSFVASQPGTYLYHSGTRPDLQVEMGLYGALVVTPASVPAGCMHAAYNHPGTCYEREYLFLLSELDLDIHRAAERQAGGVGPINVAIEPYWPEYWMINGRAAPDTMGMAHSSLLPHQPYNAVPRMHPGERLLMRVLGAGRQMHPYHFHGNHARILARDGRLLLSQTDPNNNLAGPTLFTIASLPGGTVDAIFEWTGKELGWDMYGHTAADGIPCVDGNGDGYDDDGLGGNQWEWCADHRKPMPVSLPDPNVLTNGAMYSGSPYLGLLGVLPPGEGGLNPNAGFTYMWHSHTEREMVNNDIFPGGLMTMLVIEPPSVPIDGPMQ
jgi:FtsP/CotA-like multicopper oxidase with cupredoxin domain